MSTPPPIIVARKGDKLRPPHVGIEIGRRINRFRGDSLKRRQPQTARKNTKTKRQKRAPERDPYLSDQPHKRKHRITNGINLTNSTVNIFQCALVNKIKFCIWTDFICTRWKMFGFIYLRFLLDMRELFVWRGAYLCDVCSCWITSWQI